MATLSYRNQSTDRSMRHYGKMATLPGRFSKKKPLSTILENPISTEENKPLAENLIDLRFLTEHERGTLERVVKKDLQLRKTMLG